MSLRHLQILYIIILHITNFKIHYPKSYFMRTRLIYHDAICEYKTTHKNYTLLWEKTYQIYLYNHMKSPNQ